MTGLKKKQKRLFIGICNSQERIPSKFFWSFYNLRPVCPMEVVRATHPWDVVRNNQLIQAFLRSECTIFAKMDVDQQYPADYLEKMIPLVDEYKVVGPLIYDRWRNNDFMPLMFSRVAYPRLKKLEGWKRDSGVLEVPYAHTNLFVAREVWENVPKPWYEAHLRWDGLQRDNHVDFDVLDKIKKAGYPIHINTDVVVEHLTEQPVDVAFYDRWNSQE